MRRILSVLLENESGALSRVIGLFSQRGYNIESLTVAPTDDPTLSRMTIQTVGDEKVLEQIEKQLNKKLDIIKVRTFHEEQSISRELMLIKVKYNRTNRKDIMEVCSILKAEIVDMSKSFMMIQICAEPERIQLLIQMLKSISIVEVARTGTLALPKCAENE